MTCQVVSNHKYLQLQSTLESSKHNLNENRCRMLIKHCLMCVQKRRENSPCVFFCGFFFCRNVLNDLLGWWLASDLSRHTVVCRFFEFMRDKLQLKHFLNHNIASHSKPILRIGHFVRTFEQLIRIKWSINRGVTATPQAKWIKSREWHAMCDKKKTGIDKCASDYKAPISATTNNSITLLMMRSFLSAVFVCFFFRSFVCIWPDR